MLGWFLSENKLHKLIRGLENCPKGREVAPLHGILYINFTHKCTMIHLLTTVDVLDVFFLRILLCFPLSLVCSLIKRIMTVFTWWKYNYGINFASWNLRFCFSPNNKSIHVSIVLRLFFTLRKYISSLHMQRFSSFFWPSWYSTLTKVRWTLDNSSWEA